MIEPNNIYLGDSYELIKEIPDKSIDLIYTDIPYLINYSGGGIMRSKLRHVKEFQDQKERLLDGIDFKILDEFVRVLKYIYIYIWCSKQQIMDILNYFNQKKDCSFDILCWCKDNPVPFGSSPFLSDIEYCLCIHEKGTKFNQGYDHKSKWYLSHLNQQDKKEYKHPTIKPKELVKRHLLNSTKEGDIVLDTFMGSGTTCKACQELGRQYIGIEINEQYYNIAKDRLNNINAKGEVSLF